ARHPPSQRTAHQKHLDLSARARLPFASLPLIALQCSPSSSSYPLPFKLVCNRQQQDRLSVDGPSAVGVEAPLLQFQSRVPSRASVSAISSASAHQKTVKLGTVEPPVLALLKHWSKPAVVALALLLCVLFFPEAYTPAYAALAVTAVLISRQVFSPLCLLSANSARAAKFRLPRLMLEWVAVVALLLFLGFALKLEQQFPRNVMLGWFALTTITLLVGDYCSARVFPRSGSTSKRYIIIGANDVGVELARRISQTAGMGTFMGFSDFRSLERLPTHTRGQFAGKCKDVAAFVRRNAVNAIYIALPMSHAPRIEEMLHELRDTTASIYFVPDIFAFDLVQARCVEIHGIPIL